jgi:hypothetical protein
VAGVLVVWSLGVIFIGYTFPADGWTTLTGPEFINFVFGINVSGEPSLLQEGDVLLAVNGHPLQPGYLPPIPPNSQIGQTLHYTVERNGQMLEVVVPLVQRSPLGVWHFIVWNIEHGGLRLFMAVLSLAITAFAFTRRPSNLSARLLLLFGFVFFITGYNDADWSFYQWFYPAPWAFLTMFINVGLYSSVLLPSLILMPLVFPERKQVLGRFFHLLLVLLYGLPAGLTALAITLVLATGRAAWMNIFLVVNLSEAIIFAVVFLIAMIQNFRTLRDPIQQAQLRWVAFGLGIGFAFPALVGGVLNFFRTIDPTFQLIIVVINNLLLLTIPISFTIAILRYRLFDIDLIIRKTVLWAIVSGFGLAVYLLAVGATSFFLGSQPDYVIPLVALIAVAFIARPLYRKLEQVLDRMLPLKPREHQDE